MSLKMNERYSGTSHITAEDEAAVKAAIVGSTGLIGGYEINEEDMTAVSAAVPNGTFCWNGRCGKISSESAVTWTAPSSGKFAKVWVCVHYTKSNSVESVSIDKVMSEEKSSQTAAENAEFPNSTSLGSETTESWLPLFCVVVSNSEVKNSAVIQPVILSLNGLAGKCADIEDGIASVSDDLSDEAGERAAAIGTLDERLAAIETARKKTINQTLSTVTKNISCIYSEANYYTSASVAIVEVEFTHSSVAYTHNVYLPLDSSGNYYEATYVGAGKLGTYSETTTGSAAKTDEQNSHKHGISTIYAPCYCRVLVWGDSANSRIRAKIDDNYVESLTAKITNITFIGKV